MKLIITGILNQKIKSPFLKTDKELFCKRCGIFHLRNTDNYYFNNKGFIAGCKHYLCKVKTPYTVARKTQQQNYYRRNLDKKKTFNPILRKQTRSATYSFNSKNLTDVYIIKALSVKFGISINEIKNEYTFMIEIYRLHIKCMRACNAPKNLQSFIKTN